MTNSEHVKNCLKRSSFEKMSLAIYSVLKDILKTLSRLRMVELRPGAAIPLSQTVTNLGGVLDQTLSLWKPYLDHLSHKIKRVMYLLRFFQILHH